MRRTRDFNRALITKWGWLLLQDSTARWAEVLRKKYIHFRNYLDVESKSVDSNFWKGLVSVKDLVRKRACKLIGIGEKANIWCDP